MSRVAAATWCNVGALAVAALVAFVPPAANAQSFTWTAAAATTDWNTAGNWNPNSSFPNSSTAMVTFGPTGAGPVNISASVLAQSLTFTATNYNLTSSAGQTLSGVTAINTSGVVLFTTINLASLTSGNSALVR